MKHDHAGPLSRLSSIGYTIGGVSTEGTIVRVEISYQGESAWVEMGRQTRDLAAGTITLAEIRDAALKAKLAPEAEK